MTISNGKEFERPKGEWIEGTVELSVFDEPLPYMCPFCSGADMRKKEGDNK